MQMFQISGFVSVFMKTTILIRLFVGGIMISLSLKASTARTSLHCWVPGQEMAIFTFGVSLQRLDRTRPKPEVMADDMYLWNLCEDECGRYLYTSSIFQRNGCNVLVYFSRKPWVISCRTIRASSAQPVEHHRHA